MSLESKHTKARFIAKIDRFVALTTHLVAQISRFGNFCVHDNNNDHNDDRTDCFTPCACMQGNN